MTAEEKVLAAGYEGVLLLADYSYDDALVIMYPIPETE